MLLSLRVLVDFVLVGLLLVGYMVIYSIPEPNQFSDEYYIKQCEYDTRTLCLDCFRKPVNCYFFKKNISFIRVPQFDERLGLSNQYFHRLDVVNEKEQVVIKNINQNRTIELFLSLICSELNIKVENCGFTNNETFPQELRKRILSGNPLPSGVLFCPTGDERGLQRFVDRFNQPELMTLLLMSTNSHPLMLRLLSQHNNSVPSLIFQEGFLLVESYDGLKLRTFYRHSLITRLRIAYELINAFFEFDMGVDSFRFYLTDVDPDNFVVKKNGDEEVKILFANLKSVIIRNSLTEKQKPYKHYLRHSRNKCGDHCIGYVPEDVCDHYYTDINLFAVCLLLCDNDVWKEKDAFLDNDEKGSEFTRIDQKLHQCAYCEPYQCVHRYELLKEVQQLILTGINSLSTISNNTVEAK